MHARTIGVEDARDLDLHAVLAVIIEEKRLGTALAFIIAAAQADRVHIAPIGFGLGMLRGIAIDFAGGSLQDRNLDALGQAEHVDGAHDRNLGGLHRIMLIMNGRGRTGQIVNGIDLHEKRKADIVTHELETRMVVQMGNIGFGTGEQIVHAQHFVARFDQPVDQMRSDEARTARDQYSASAEIIACHGFSSPSIVEICTISGLERKRIIRDRSNTAPRYGIPASDSQLLKDK